MPPKASRSKRDNEEVLTRVAIVSADRCVELRKIETREKSMFLLRRRRRRRRRRRLSIAGQRLLRGAPTSLLDLFFLAFPHFSRSVKQLPPSQIQVQAEKVPPGVQEELPRRQSR